VDDIVNSFWPVLVAKPYLQLFSYSARCSEVFAVSGKFLKKKDEPKRSLFWKFLPPFFVLVFEEFLCLWKIVPVLSLFRHFTVPVLSLFGHFYCACFITIVVSHCACFITIVVSHCACSITIAFSDSPSVNLLGNIWLR
jgi:hypothetical protein